MTKTKTIKTTCSQCAGKGIVPHRHITNKRNSKPCPKCEGKGDHDLVIEIKN